MFRDFLVLGKYCSHWRNQYGGEVFRAIKVSEELLRG
jgi:hypothetical protein